MSNERKVEILCLMDRSGSMGSIINEAVGAFNAFIKEQKKIKGKAKVTLASFDNNYELVYDRIKLKDTPVLKVEDVKPRGATALNDSIAKLVHSAGDKKDVILLIQTDGYENASREYNNPTIKKLIEEKEALGWDVNFIGAGMKDVVEQGAMRGFNADKSFFVSADTKGMSDYKTTMSLMATSYRTK